LQKNTFRHEIGSAIDWYNEHRPHMTLGGPDVSDNDIQHAERGGAISLSGASQRTRGAAYGRLKHAEVLRNRVLDTGFRHGYSPWSSIPAITVSLPVEQNGFGDLATRRLIVTAEPVKLYLARLRLGRAGGCHRAETP
jgi:hypothetical protein